MPKKKEPQRFDINAAVVFRLGEELITDNVQALVELVKNSYDADATWVRVTIDTKNKNTLGRKYADAKGTIVVEDNGHGMDEKTIRRGWLTIANSPKREQKALGRTTLRGRTPIGDKGLGRLGSQRLAHNVEIVTTPMSQPNTEQYIGFSWRDFRESSSLSQVPVTYKAAAVNGKRQGTKLILSGLVELENWQDKERVLDLQRQLSGMISPFEEAKDFRVRLNVDGSDLELAEIAKKVRETALVKYKFEFDGRNLQVSGRARLSYFRPRVKKDAALFKSVCERDAGAALYKFLFGRKSKGRPEHFVLCGRKGWFAEFGTLRALDDIDTVKRVPDDVDTMNGAPNDVDTVKQAKKLPINPGPFRGEVDSISLDSSQYKDSVVSRHSQYRNLVKDLAGIRVYRDGFGIRVGQDWLGLGKQQTEATSYYGLRPGNVLGFVAITARDNPDLLETTSREGFQLTPHYENFFLLLTEFVRFARDSQEFLRRGVLRFLNEHRDRQAGVEPEEPHTAVTRRIENIAVKLSSQRNKVARRTGSLTEATAGAAQKLGTVRRELVKELVEGSPVASVLKDLEQEISAVSKEVAREEKLLQDISTTLDQATELQSMKEVLDRRWDTMNEQMAALYESVSLGLTAEALSHEIHNIASRLASKSSALLREIRGGRERRASLVAFIEEVRSSVAAMRKQIAHLTPSLRYLREQREQINVVEFLHDFANFYHARMEGKRIEIKVQVQSEEFSVNMNKGKLTQVFDNLFLNAEYWLNEAIRAEYIGAGEITVDVDAPFVRVSDNGRGVDESVEDTLFEPFVTMKRTGQGRGLGLFVCGQLLDSESCGLVLLPDRNQHGRKFAFELDLSGAVCE